MDIYHNRLVLRIRDERHRDISEAVTCEDFEHCSINKDHQFLFAVYQRGRCAMIVDDDHLLFWIV